MADDDTLFAVLNRDLAQDETQPEESHEGIGYNAFRGSQNQIPYDGQDLLPARMWISILQNI